MISRQKAVKLFIAARERQAAEYRGDLAETEIETQAREARLRRANDVLDLTAKFGGDFKKAAAEYASAKQDIDILPLQKGHHHQPNAHWFNEREAALEKLAEVMDGNPVLEETFEVLFEETAVAAIWRNYSNGRGLFFVSPFIGGVLLNTVEGWRVKTVDELEKAIEAAIPVARLNYAKGIVGEEWLGVWLRGGKAPFIHTMGAAGSNPYHHVVGWKMVDMETYKKGLLKSSSGFGHQDLQWRVSTRAEWEIMSEMKIAECDEVPEAKQGGAHWTEKIRGVLTFALKNSPQLIQG
jgi:hypothetical protein